MSTAREKYKEKKGKKIKIKKHDHFMLKKIYVGSNPTLAVLAKMSSYRKIGKQLLAENERDITIFIK